MQHEIEILHVFDVHVAISTNEVPFAVLTRATRQEKNSATDERKVRHVWPRPLPILLNLVEAFQLCPKLNTATIRASPLHAPLFCQFDSSIDLSGILMAMLTMNPLLFDL
jgi:hypothetical protein